MDDELDNELDDDNEELSDDDLLSMVKETLGNEIKGFDDDDDDEEEPSPEEEPLPILEEEPPEEEPEEEPSTDGETVDIEEAENINEEAIDGNDIELDKLEEEISNINFEESNEESNIEEEKSEEDVQGKKIKLPIFKMPKLKLPSFLTNLTPSRSNMLVYILLLMIAVIIIGSIFIIKFIKAGQRLEDEIFYMDSTIVIEEFIQGSNNANFIFISESRNMENHTFALSRMLIDKTATVFHFSDNINWELFTIELSDNNGKNYSLKNSFYEENNTSRSVSFEPLDTGIRGIILTITENSTGEEVKFAIRFDTVISVPTVSYLNDRTTLKIKDDITVNLEGGVFSSAGSTIYYTIHSDSNDSLYFNDISIIQGGNNLLQERHLTYKLENENYSIARVDFAPVRNIDGNINVKFSDVYRAHRVDLEVPLQNLFRNTVNDQITIPAGSNTLVLERIGRLGDNYVLVLHGLNEEGERIETRLNATLRYENYEGQEVILQGTTRSGARGSDMRFNVNQLGDNTMTGGLSTFVLDIEEVLFIEEDITIPISLSSLPYASNTASEKVINEGKRILLNEGYTNVETVTYMLDSYRFIGVYSARSGNHINEYILNGTRDGSQWEFTVEPIN